MLVGVVVICAILALSSGDKCCNRKFRENGFVPLFAKGIYTTDLELSFDNRQVKCGEIVSDVNSRRAPTLKLDVTKYCKNVTVIMFTPIAPPFNFSYLIWLVHNVDSKVLKEGFSNGGNVIDILEGTNKQGGDVRAPYEFKKDDTVFGTVREDSRFIYFIYCQCHYISDISRYLLKTSKWDFDVRNYTKEHGLDCPVAGFYHIVSMTGVVLPEMATLPRVDTPKWPKDNLPVQNPSNLQPPVNTPPVNAPKVP